MLNAYFTEVMDVIFNNKGTLIKFIGDAVFALWGAPIKIPDHARLSCETALIMQKEVQKFNRSKRFPALNTRIGINTGPMVVGNLGSSRRFDFTAIGDSVNLASRLESLNKQFGTWILVSESTRKEAGSKFSFLSLGTIKASGKKESVGVYALFDDPIPTDVENQWLKAINKFRIRAWDEAEAQFRAASENEVRLKKAAELYLHELAQHRISAPEENWQGEIEFLTK
jgi:adenylate cyclase